MNFKYYLFRFLYAVFPIILSCCWCISPDAAPYFRSQEKPWTYWWWMGSSVSPQDISEQLREMQKAGIGGVHIIPIYGEKGDEKNYIPYLSEKWLDMLQHTLREADKLKMGVDMSLGTGWPFGGPDIPIELRAQRLRLQKGVPTIIPTGQKVKRAAPGGEGFVIDHFNREAIDFYCKRFYKAFSQCELKPRALYNDSYEVFGADSTLPILEKFRSLRGYDLEPWLPLLLSDSPHPDKERVLCDYRETLSDLLREEFARPWIEHCHAMGIPLVRYEAHGSPGNLLDLYALADIPETESFGMSDIKIPLLRHDPKYEEERFGRPHPLTMKFASSPAHLTDKSKVSSESTTWLGDHFSVALSQIKPQIDEMFTAGVNHIFFHGTTYSPYWKEFPGRLFYASTHYGHTSHFWNQLPALTDYIARCQKILQQTRPDNDILLYYPIYDFWSDANRPLLKMIDIHRLYKNLQDTSFGQIATALWEQGWTFDYISDLQLRELPLSQIEKRKVIIIPRVSYIPHETMEALYRHAQNGIPVLFIDQYPEDVPGLNQYSERTFKLNTLKSLFSRFGTPVSQEHLPGILNQKGFHPEPFKSAGIDFIRKKFGSCTIYFLANLSPQNTDQFFPFPKAGCGIAFLNVDPQQSSLTLAVPEIRHSIASTESSQLEFRLQLAPGNTIFLLCWDETSVPQFADSLSILKELIAESTLQSNLPLWNYQDPDPNLAPLVLNETWSLEAVSMEGNPSINGKFSLDEPQDWTLLGGDWQYYSGRASYSTVFTLPPKYQGYSFLLSLGDVRESAQVILNETPLPLLWHHPFTLFIPSDLLRVQNKLSIEVNNLSYNRIIKMDQDKIPWKNFHEINFVNIQYKPFDASKDSPLPSGLLSTPELIPVNLILKN